MTFLKDKKRFILYALLPLLAIIILSTGAVYESKKQYDDLILLDKMVEVSLHTSNLVHEIQKERGMSLGFVSSNGEKFSSLLKKQIKRTDKQIKIFKFQLSNAVISYSKNKRIYSTIFAMLKELKTLRNKVLHQKLSSKTVLFRYTTLIRQLLNSINGVDKPLVNNKINKQIYAYYTFLLAKEQVGLERALITQILHHQHVNTITYADMISLRTLEKSYLQLSLENSSQTLRKDFSSRMKKSNIHQIDKIEEILLSIKQKVILDLDSEVWFLQISKKINLLQDFEKLYIDTLKKEMKQINQETFTTLMNTLFINLIVVIFFIFFTKLKLKSLRDYFNSVIVNLKRINEEKIKDYEDITFSFVDIIEQRDAYTAGHSRRVSYYCKLIALHMGYSNAEIETLEKAALLHDIGKIQTPDNILLKPSKLTNLEYQLIKEHSLVGYKILKEMSLYKDLAEIIKGHHERYDGSGYPLGLKADEIPALTRILIIADAFDAMTTNRIYKPRQSKEKALIELQKLKGSQFHPKEVDAAVTVLKHVIIPDNIHQQPLSKIEEERFSYFYKDQLTHCYNHNYYKIKMIENKENREFKEAVSIKLQNFSQYNESFGWSSGDEILNDIASFLKEIFPLDLVFRVEGDDFIVLHNGNFCIEQLRKDIYTIIDNNIIGVHIESIHC